MQFNPSKCQVFQITKNTALSIFSRREFPQQNTYVSPLWTTSNHTLTSLQKWRFKASLKRNIWVYDRVLKSVGYKTLVKPQLENDSTVWNMYSATTTDISKLSQCMRFPTMWYVRPAKLRISLRINNYIFFLKIDSYTHCKIIHVIMFYATVLDSLSYTCTCMNGTLST